ncbi:unnamed protein product [marine sediment metagenome]|uniref:Uncharacterized protein n=1 Tax=marine sediment metagenome TaxID=412755 RepID=X1BG11_9ZZZZ
MGLNAGCYGEGLAPTWDEDATSDTADFGDSPALSVKSNFGFKKTQIAYDGTNLVDIGVIAMDTYYTVAVGTDHS